MKDYVRDKINRLEEIRKNKGMTIQEFAEEELSITRQSYYNWKDGQNPNLENFQLIKDYLYKEE